MDEFYSNKVCCFSYEASNCKFSPFIHLSFDCYGSCSPILHARPLSKDRRKFWQMADPLLQGQCPARGWYQALVVAAMCIQEQLNMRPLMADVFTTLTYLASQKYDPKDPANPEASFWLNHPKDKKGRIVISVAAKAIRVSTQVWRWFVWSHVVCRIGRQFKFLGCI